MIRSSDGRLRRVMIAENVVLDWFSNAASHWTGQKILSLPMMDGLPEDAKVESVHHDPMSKRFLFTVHSSSFSEVPAGDLIPEWENLLTMPYVAVEIRTDQDRLREQQHEAAHIDACVQYTHPDGKSKDEIRNLMTLGKSVKGKEMIDHEKDIETVKKMASGDFFGEIGDGVAAMARLVLDLAMPVKVWHFKDSDPANKEAVLKAAREQMDRTNIMVPRIYNRDQKEVAGPSRLLTASRIFCRDGAEKAVPAPTSFSGVGNQGPAGSLPSFSTGFDCEEDATTISLPKELAIGQPVVGVNATISKFEDLWTMDANAERIVAERIAKAERAEKPTTDSGEPSEGQAMLDFFKGT